MPGGHTEPALRAKKPDEAVSMTTTSLLNPRVRRQRSRLRRPFTLLEMLIAMAVLAVIMLILFRFFANVQDAWSVSMNTTELYENARVALDIVTRDLQAAVAKANDIPGQHIRFHQAAGDKLWFITSGDPSDAAKSSLIEVGYRLNDNHFERAFVDDTNANWNIYGPRDDASHQDGYLKVIGAVLQESFVCYDASLSPYTPNNEGNETFLPSMVSITLRLIDSKSFELWKRLPEAQRPELEQKVSRTFRKTIYLGNQ
jgi:type II secretion system protein J